MKKKILIVDDNMNIRVILALTFSEDFEIHEARTGLEAVEMARGLIPDLIVMDVMLPGLDGYSAVARIRCIEGLKNVPVFIITADGSKDLKAFSHMLGIIMHFTKPFDPERLLSEALRAVA